MLKRPLSRRFVHPFPERHFRPDEAVPGIFFGRHKGLVDGETGAVEVQREADALEARRVVKGRIGAVHDEHQFVDAGVLAEQGLKN